MTSVSFLVVNGAGFGADIFVVGGVHSVLLECPGCVRIFPRSSHFDTMLSGFTLGSGKCHCRGDISPLRRPATASLLQLGWPMLQPQDLFGPFASVP